MFSQRKYALPSCVHMHLYVVDECGVVFCSLHLQTFSCKIHRFYFMEMEIRTSPQLDSGLTSSRIPHCFQWIPLAPIMEKLSLPQENHGAVRCYFIQTLDDHMLPPDVQEKLVRENPPDGIFKIKGGDRCPFFSKPHSLQKVLVEIAQIKLR